jgi:hypothetical protein
LGALKLEGDSALELEGDSEDGALSERLVKATVRTAVRIARDRMPPALVMSPHAYWLVEATMRTLARNPWLVTLGLVCAAGS